MVRAASARGDRANLPITGSNGIGFRTSAKVRTDDLRETDDLWETDDLRETDGLGSSGGLSFICWGVSEDIDFDLLISICWVNVIVESWMSSAEEAWCASATALGSDGS